MFSFLEVSLALNCSLKVPDHSQQFQAASIDTRTITSGNLFVALKGDNSDGHDFLEVAFSKGAAGAIISKKFYLDHVSKIEAKSSGYKNLLISENPEKTFQDLATWLRQQFKAITIGVTGSVGKTSTKEFLTYLLSYKHSVLSTAGNLNNHLGLPLTLSRLTAQHEYCVAEIGASAVGEIRFLCDILKPDFGILTQVSPSHLEGFGSLEAIYQTKLELGQALIGRGRLVIPDFDLKLIEKAKLLKIPFVLVGNRPGSQYLVSNVTASEGFIYFAVNGKQFRFPGLAVFLAQNAALAVAMAHELGLSEDQIPRHWDDLKLPSGRFESQKVGGVLAIFDGYNANPVSFAKAVQTFGALKVSGRKFLVFSDMLELGSEEKVMHEALGRAILAEKIDRILAYGPRSLYAIDVIRQEIGQIAEHFQSAEELSSVLISEISTGDAVLFKGSRGMKVEKVLNALKENKSPGANLIPNH